MNAIIGRSGTRKTKPILDLIAEIYCVSHNIARREIQLEQVRRRWTEAKNPKVKYVFSRLSAVLKRLRMSKMVLLAPTNTEYNILEERIQQIISVFDHTEEVWMSFLPVYRWLGTEEDITSRAHLHETHIDMLPATCHVQLKEGITLCTLGSVYRAFPFRDG